MKKLALLLGSLLVVGVTAQAKEVIVAPVEESKEVVVVAEPVVEEVVVVEEPAFRPSGYVGLEYRAYGETEGQNDKTFDGWNAGGNNRARLQTSVGIELTERASLAIRVRDYTSLETGAAEDIAEKVDLDKVGKNKGTETRLQYFYRHTDSLTSKVQYRDEEDDSQNLEYKLIYNAYQNDGGLVELVTLEPKLYHSMAANNGGNYYNRVGLDIGYVGNLPLGFTYDGMLYLNYNMYNEDQAMEVSNNELKYEDKEFAATWEFYLRRKVALYSTDKYNVDFNFVGGYDPYDWSQYNKFGIDKKALKDGDSAAYSLYTAMDVSAKYDLTPAVSLNGGVGAEYRNWDNSKESSASTWRWQPYAFVGMRAKF